MRTTATTLAVVLSLFSLSAFGQELGGRVTFFASGIEYQTTATADNDNELNGGLGVSIGYRWTQRWDGELSVTTQRFRGRAIGTVGNTGRLIRERVQSAPVDAMLMYHLASKNRWKPYLAGGLHYISDADDSAVSPQVGGGLFYGIKEGLWLRFELRHVLLNRTPRHDPALKPSLGVVVHF